MKKSLLVVLLLNIIGMTRADIVPGKVYRISSAANEKRALFIENSSTANNAPVVLWTDTDVPSQQWEAVDNGDGTLSFVNVLTGKYLSRDNVSVTANTKIIQVTTPSIRSKWTAQATGNESNLYAMLQTNSSKTYILNANDGKDGDAPKLSEHADGNGITTGQTWIIEETVPFKEFNDELRTRMIDSWLKKHLRNRGTNQKSFGNGGGWGDAEMLETVLDAYETSGKEEYLDVFKNVFSFFQACVGTSWDHLRYDDTYKWYGHDFNDDVMWMIIASARAYHLTGNRTYLTYAKNNFDKIYDRALNQWGMLRWAEQSGNKNGTNSCINGPAEVAACYIAMGYKGTNDTYYEEYYEIARSLYENQRRYLFNAQTGQVFDAFTWNADTNLPSGYNRWVSTYNQGTMLGAAVMLYNHFGDERYRKDAEKIVEWTKKDLCNGDGIIKVCQTVDGDLCGFKGILMRYLRKYIVDLKHYEDVEWMKANAMFAYSNRNSYGVTSSAWLSKSAEDWKSATEKDNSGNFKSFGEQPFGNSTAVSAAFNAPLNAENIIKDAYSFIPAKDFNYISGVYLTDGTGGAEQEISNIRNLYYTAYSNVDFGTTPARNIQIKVSDANVANAKIEIREGDYKGTLLGTADVPTTGGWKTITANITPIDGMHNIYLVYRAGTTARDCFRMAGFSFSSDTPALPNDITDNDGTAVSNTDTEGLANLTDNRATTATTAKTQTAQFTYFSPIPVTLKGYAIASHDGDTKADPKTWTLYGSNDGETWIAIDTRSEMNFNTRCEVKKFNVKAEKSYYRYKLDITANNGAATLVIGEWQLFGTAISAYDITADGGTLRTGDPVVTDKNSSTINTVNAGENAEYIYNSKALYTLTSYSITAATANNAPKSWTLYGQKGSNWEIIDRQTKQTFACDGCTQFYKTNASESYQNFRLVADVSDNKTEIAELQLFGQVDANGTMYNDITCNGGTLTTSDNAGEELTKGLIDNNAATTYRLPFNGNAWIQYHTEIPARLTAYRVISGYDNSKNPKNWILEGSNDGQTWTRLNTVTNAVFSKKGTIKNTTVSNSNSYNYFRLTVTKASADDTEEIEIGELQLHGICLSDKDIIGTSGTTTAEMPGTNNNESPDKLFDNSADTKYCFDYYGSAWVAYESDSPVMANMYSITSANDNTNRNPKSWELQASDNGTTWTTLDKRSDEEFYGFKTTQFYIFGNDRAYRHYRLQILENKGELLSQFSEWQLFYNGKAATGIDNTVSNTEIAISYNRTDRTICVTLPEAATISIYNANGQTVAKHMLQAGNNRIAADGLANGIYIVKATAGGKSQSAKIIK